MKKWTEVEDKLILDSIPEDGVFTKELALTLKRQLPDRTVRSIKQHYYDKLKKEWIENKVKEAEARAVTPKPLSFWQRLISVFIPK